MNIISLELKNFQAHNHSCLTFTDGLNVIVGPSDSGKSSIIRALRKLIRDMPAGKGFITSGKSDCSIALTFEINGTRHTVTRKLTASKNLYYLDSQEYGGFGTEIPLEIQNALNMELIDLENNYDVDLHFTRQHDHPFLIGDTASQRSRVIGRVTGLHVLDRAIGEVNKKVKEVLNARELAEISKKTLEDELSKLPDVNELELKLEQCADNLTTIQQKNVLISKLSGVSSQLKDVVFKGKAAAAEHARILPNGVPDVTSFKLKLASLTAFKKLYEDWKTVTNAVEVEESLKISQITVDTSPVIELISKKAQLKTLKDDLDELHKLKQSYNLSKISKELSEAEESWNDELKKAGICPVCKRPT